MTRKEFLTEYLGALGAVDILWHKELDNYISGTVVYDLNDPEETQDFCWHKSEQEVPDNIICNMASLLKSNNLLDSDKIKVSRETLHTQYNKAFNTSLSTKQFTSAIEALEHIEVPMVDEGKETDTYFIHE